MELANPAFFFLVFILLIFITSPLVLKIVQNNLANDNKGRNKKLEGLRGLLAPAVFFHHAIITFYFYQTQKWEAPTSDFYNKLGPGPVLLFFFMTGFLFWGQNTYSKKPFSWNHFIFKRMKRLMPAYYMSLILILIIVFSFSKWTLKTDVLTLFHAMFTWVLFGFPFGEFKPINDYTLTLYVNAAVAWSLRFEWLFYLLFGWLRQFSTIKKYFILLLALTIVKKILEIHFINDIFKPVPALSHLAGLYKDFYYFFVIGFNFGILASYLDNEKIRSRISKPIFRIGGLLVLLVYLFNSQVPAYGIYGSCLLFLFFISVVLDNSNKHFLHWKGFQALGHISYSVYLLHGICLFVAFHAIDRIDPIISLSPNKFWAYVLGTGVFVLLASAISYRYVELPFINKNSTT